MFLAYSTPLTLLYSRPQEYLAYLAYRQQIPKKGSGAEYGGLEEPTINPACRRAISKEVVVPNMVAVEGPLILPAFCRANFKKVAVPTMAKQESVVGQLRQQAGATPGMVTTSDSATQFLLFFYVPSSLCPMLVGFVGLWVGVIGRG